MKKYLFILIALIIIPTVSFADSIPQFPMAFYGNVTINGNKAPNGTIIRAYYRDTLAGESTVDSSGAYGYISSTGKKLLVSEGTGLITFTFQSASILSNRESIGKTAISYPGFEEGLVFNKDLAFSYSNGGGSSGGGGGGNPITPSITLVSCLHGVLFDTTTGKPCTTYVPITNDCPIGALFNPLTGVKCSSLSTTPAIPSIVKLAHISITRTLKLNMIGEDVKQLQIYLNTHGFIIATKGVGSPNNETTKFGGLTKKAVIKFQLANSLKGDGVVGPMTIGRMR